MTSVCGTEVEDPHVVAARGCRSVHRQHGHTARAAPRLSPAAGIIVWRSSIWRRTVQALGAPMEGSVSCGPRIGRNETNVVVLLFVAMGTRR